jgi:hypothetical protein
MSELHRSTYPGDRKATHQWGIQGIMKSSEVKHAISALAHNRKNEFNLLFSIIITYSSS